LDLSLSVVGRSIDLSLSVVGRSIDLVGWLVGCDGFVVVVGCDGCGAPKKAPTNPGAELNATHPEHRYVFNTLVENPLGDDFTVPTLIANVTTDGEFAGGFSESVHGR
jgi:hypothetical protein